MIPLTQHQRLTASKLNMVTVAVSYAIFSISMLFRPSRWINAVAYHTMTEILPIHIWGIMFVIAALMLFSAAIWSKRWWIVAALTGGIMLACVWFIPAFIQYVEASTVTPVSWVTWLLFVYILVRAAFILDSPEKVRIIIREKGSDDDSDGGSPGDGNDGGLYQHG